MDDLIRRYNKYIYDRTTDLIKSGKDFDDFDNFDLAKIFEYYSSIKLSQEYKQVFYEYSDIDPEFKELNGMSKNDTGIDLSNLVDTIVQCKLRKDNLNWKECSTFFGSNVVTDDNGELKIKWKKMIITRNDECTLSDNLKHKQKLFIDKAYPRKDIIDYCKKLLDSPPKEKKETQKKSVIRDYQKECIDMIKDSNENIIISLPTGTGKNFIIVHALNSKDKYLILVPRIILMEQIMNEIIKYKPKYKSSIQMIGDGNTTYDEDKNITICVYNSVNIIEKHIENFDKIFVDEAHHIMKPEIYKTEEELDIDSDYDSDDDSDDEDYDSEDSDNSDDSDDSDDSEDNESSDNKNYIDIIKSFRTYNNNIYLSATIDKNDKFKYYSKDIRDMIDEQYLCDYNITIPIFSDDPTNKNICKYLIEKYRNVIIYCNSQKEGIKINKLMNSIQKNSSEYIDCNTLKSKRNKILDKYKSGDLPFLVNVKILVEGFDAPITKGVCFMHLPSSKTTLIQIIGRALRLHHDKVIANIILPFSDNKDELSINNFLKVMATNDSRIRKSYMNKKVDGYVNIDKVIDKKDEDEDEEMENSIELKYELIFDKMGKLRNRDDVFIMYNKLKEWININNKLPSNGSKNKEEKQLGDWCALRRQHKKKNKLNEDKIKLLEQLNGWYWIENNINRQLPKTFEETYEILKIWIQNNKKIPSYASKNDEEKRLATWCCKKRLDKEENKLDNTQIKLLEEINGWYWTENNNRKPKTFEETYEILKVWIENNKKFPSYASKNIEEKHLSAWCCKKRLDKKENKLNDDIIKKLEEINGWYWTENNNHNRQQPKSFDETYEKLKVWINNNKRLPVVSKNSEEEKKLGQWCHQQRNFYKNNILDKEKINKLNEINEWYWDKDDIFLTKYNSLSKWIQDNNKLPSGASKNKEEKHLARWCLTLRKIYNENKLDNDKINKLILLKYWHW